MIEINTLHKNVLGMLLEKKKCSEKKSVIVKPEQKGIEMIE